MNNNNNTNPMTMETFGRLFAPLPPDATPVRRWGISLARTDAEVAAGNLRPSDADTIKVVHTNNYLQYHGIAPSHE